MVLYSQGNIMICAVYCKGTQHLASGDRLCVCLQESAPGQKVYGAVLHTERQLAALCKSDLTALIVLRLDSINLHGRGDAVPELMVVGTATKLVWLTLPRALPSLAASQLDLTRLKGMAMLEMRRVYT
jgi:hypothetical protein